jgi:hypothetical protein
MSRALIVLNGTSDRQKAIGWVKSAPAGCRLEFKHSRRSIPQNDRMWAMLTDLAKQVTWHGVKLTPQDWKLMMLSALKKELRIVPNLDGDGFVNLGQSSSDLSKTEMGELIELIAHFGATRGVKFGDDLLSVPKGETEKAGEAA